MFIYFFFVIRWTLSNVIASRFKVRGFKSGRARWIFVVLLTCSSIPSPDAARGVTAARKMRRSCRTSILRSRPRPGLWAVAWKCSTDHCYTAPNMSIQLTADLQWDPVQMAQFVQYKYIFVDWIWLYPKMNICVCFLIQILRIFGIWTPLYCGSRRKNDPFLYLHPSDVKITEICFCRYKKMSRMSVYLSVIS